MRVNNRKTINNLTWRSLKGNKSRNIIAILAIALTSTLFTTIFAIGGNMLENMQNATMRQVGTSAHGGLKYLTQAQFDDFSKSSMIKDISYSIIVGGAENEELAKKQTEIRYAEDDWARWGFSYPTVGEMPSKALELACSTITLDMLNIPHEIGQKVPLKFSVHGKTYEEVFTLSGYWPGDDVMQATQVFLSREYVDSIVKIPEVVDLEQGFDGVIGTINADLWFSNSLNIDKKMEDLVRECGYGLDEINWGVNWAYIGNEIDPTTAILVLVLAMIILISGYLIIYSIFTISVTGDIQFYGLLKTIGTTGKQLRRIVWGQALSLSILGIPLGLLLGFLLGYVLTPYVNSLTTIGNVTYTSVNPFIFIFSALFSLVTIFISCRKPSKIAAKVSPVEAVRYSGVKNSTKKTSKKARKVSPFSMAWVNVWRTPGKLAVVVVSMSLSLILMNSVYSIVEGFDMEEYLKTQIATDFTVTDHSMYSAMAESNFQGVDNGVLNGIQQFEGLEDSANIYFREEDHKLSEKALENITRTLDGLEERILQEWKHMGDTMSKAKDEGILSMHIYGLGELALQVAAEGLDIDLEKLSSGNYVLISHIEADNDNEYSPVYEIGDKISLTNNDGVTKEFEVIGYLEYPYVISVKHSHIINNDIVMSENSYLDFYGEENQPMMTILNVEDDAIKAADLWLKDYCESGNPSLDYRSREHYEDEFKSMQSTYLLCGGALSLILMLIGILNFVNTNFTSIFARKRELAMLKGVGMTEKQLNSMLFSEGGIYVIITIFFSIIFGTLVNWSIIRNLAGQLWFFKWNFTVMPLILPIIPLIAICMVVPFVCYKLIQKESIVERLRLE